MARRKIIQIDEAKCTGCGLCVTDCAEGALAVVNGKARVVSETFCDGLGACIGSCPEGALKIIEREAPEFDQAAVDRHLEAQQTPEQPPTPPAPMACGCPGSTLRTFAAPQAGHQPPADREEPRGEVRPVSSELTQWPIQLRLVPPQGKLYEGRDLMLIADCVAVAYPDLHRRLVRGNTIILTCPKLDDAETSIAKLAAIFQNPLRSISVAIMEVPCCSGLLRIAQEALDRAGVQRELRVTRIGIQGEVLEQWVE